MKKVYIETYGCQMNVNDTEVVFSILAREGYERTTEIGEADVIMANTCSVRDNAEQRIWGRIEQFNLQRRDRPVVIGILGCMAERLKGKLLDTRKVDTDGKASACNARDPGLIPGSRRSHGEGNVNPLQDSCLGNSMDRESWWAAVHGVTESDTTD